MSTSTSTSARAGRTVSDLTRGSASSPVSGHSGSGSGASAPVHLTIDDLGTALHTVEFCVVDLETTGGRADDLGITEVGAVRVKAGEVLGEFQTLVNPSRPIPSFVSVLTGITDADVARAPTLAAVLPSFLEFSRECVLVAHNAPYDTGYLRAACEAFGYVWRPRGVIDTARLARSAIGRDEVANHKLATLARHFQATTTPNHRALDDARATVDVLHALIARLGSVGVTTLEELSGYTNRVSDTVRRKRHLADGLPSAPGVYIFIGPRDETLYVGTSRDIRSRVRTYFTASEQRTRMGEMVALATSVTPLVCATPLEAAVRELRLIAERQPRYNRRSRHPERRRWLKLTVENAPRLSLVRAPGQDADDGAVYLGPVSRRTADHITEVLQLALSLRSCNERLSARRPRTPCSLFGMGRCCAPCSGPEGMNSYESIVDNARRALTSDAWRVVQPVLDKLGELSGAQRYEEAASLVSQLRTYLRVADGTQQRQALSDAGEVVAGEFSDGTWMVHVIRHGRLAGAARGAPGAHQDDVALAALATASTVPAPTGPGPAALTEETDALLSWLHRPTVRLLDVTNEWLLPVGGAGGALQSLERRMARQVQAGELPVRHLDPTGEELRRPT